MKRLFILGASTYNIPCILAAQELGCTVIASDKNPKAPGARFADHFEDIDITDVQASVKIATQYKIDGVVATSDFGVRAAAHIADAMKLVGIPPEVALLATHKGLMKQRWKETGIPTASFQLARTLTEAEKAIRGIGTWPLILKPVDSRGGGSRGVSVINSPEELKQAFEFAQSFYQDEEVIIEAFIKGIEHSVETITYQGETHVIAVSDKIKTPLPYRVDKSVLYPSNCSNVQLEQIRKISRDAVRALGIQVGAAHVELVTTESGVFVFELGARCGGGATPSPIMPFHAGVDMFKEVVRIALNETPQQLVTTQNKGCVYQFLTPKPGKVVGVLGVEEVRQWKNILACDFFVASNGTIPSVKIGTDRSGFIVAGGETREEAVALAERAEKHIQILYDDRII